MKDYTHIFFDLDHTLWDFEKNCSETLSDLFREFQLSKFGIVQDDFIRTYKSVNYQMWDDYNRGRLNKEQIRSLRFPFTFEQMGLKREDVPANLNEEFLRICPAKGHVVPFAHEVLDYLSKRYFLHIITNGFKETQHIKISTSDIGKYFQEVIHSEICGWKKPDKAIFEYAIGKINSSCEECIMIGDDLFTDILGARNAGMDHVFFNRYHQQHNQPVMHEINCLRDLKNLL
ncbi:MAG: YjjG family noncanonical pyrimidine nucleotidase [Cytophagaceae bacterium]|nr:YjjG family noncanonical pyrimidine nucleotidase [Cytophagaceae bacterium]